MKPFNLDNHPKVTTGFTTPEGYFESTSELILAQMLQASEPKTLSLWERHKTTILSVAALFVMALGLSSLWYFQSQEEEDEAHWAAIESYVTEHTDLSDEAYIDYLSSSTLDSLHQPNTDKKIIEEVLLENSDLENYITQ